MRLKAFVFAQCVLIISFILVLYIIYPLNNAFNSDILSVTNGGNRYSVNKSRILCLVHTYKKHYDTKVPAVKETWGSKCDKLIFVADENNASIPTIRLGEPGHDRLWSKTREMFILANQKYLNDFDWFLKADDDTYFFMDNLRQLLSQFNASEPHYLGRKFIPYVETGYASGGAGYLLSKGSIEKLGPLLEDTLASCPNSDFEGPEDFLLAFCLVDANVTVFNPVDEKGREMFHPVSPFSAFFKNESWLEPYAVKPIKTGPDCCSPQSVSFHYVTSKNMKLMFFFNDVMRSFGYR